MKKIFTQPNKARFQYTAAALSAILLSVYFSITGYAPGPGDLKVSDAKGLISEIKLYPEAGATQELKGEIGEFIYDGTTVKISFNNVPAGTYKRINFSFYKPGENDNVNPEFGTAASGTFSLIVNGVYSDKPFTYRSESTSGKILEIDPPLVSAGGSAVLEIEADICCWFKCNNDVLSPYDAGNSGRIDRNIMVSFTKAKPVMQ
jgi:hypothetical protein